MAEFTGVGVSPGRAVARIVHMPAPVAEPSADDRLAPDADVTAEQERIATAATQVRNDLEALAQRAQGDGKAVLEATALMAADPTLVAAAQQKVAGGVPPERAVWDAAAEVADTLAALGGYMAERTRDVADVRDRIVAALSGLPAPGVPDSAEPYVLGAVDLAPADTATLDPATCVALVTAEGGPTSHTAILARALGLPAVVAAPGVVDVPAGTLVLVDGAAGIVRLDPTAAEIEQVRAVAARERSFDGHGRTADGHRVQLLANVGDPKGVAAAVEANAEGVGLFRTEFCFLGHTEAPTVEEQVAAYRAVLAAFPGKKVVVRTLDAGADKPLPFLNPAAEANPALGVRGLRTSVRFPSVLDDQLAAIAQAAAAEQATVWVMAPMVATAAEAAEFVQRCAATGLETAGVMVEVPGAALSAGHVLESARFASLGTNDLTQYTMGADRLLGELAALNDPWQPAVLHLVELTCRAGVEHDRPVGVCGEAAADPALACVLVGLGVSSLSMTPRSIPDVADVLLATTYEHCVHLASMAVDAPGSAEARAAVRAELPVLDELGL
ncbi:MAG TPA: phosphoenolpyruvate--protein phosphotransferase [Jiangellaceae bacterium]|nr:phosphoenolpyruvate--protein phosphotransferase [Jiangellaceae bacterium]